MGELGHLQYIREWKENKLSYWPKILAKNIVPQSLVLKFGQIYDKLNAFFRFD
jgi:hypothetical protein